MKYKKVICILVTLLTGCVGKNNQNGINKFNNAHCGVSPLSTTSSVIVDSNQNIYAGGQIGADAAVYTCKINATK